MKEIKQVAIVGMGALGLLFGDRIAKNMSNESVCFVADSDRVKRYANTVFTINGEEKHFIVKSKEEVTPVDLVIVATKYNHLPQVLDIMSNLVDKNTTIISVINGISSEEIIGKRYGVDKVLITVAQGMDAVKSGGEFTYTNAGELRTGLTCEVSEERFKALIAFFEKAGIPYTIDEDIIRRMWSKFMLNVGVNQTCMVYETTYSGLNEGEPKRVTQEAMREAIKVANAEGIDLNSEDAKYYTDLMNTLDPLATPSMRQDGIKKLPSEVEMFAGKIIELGKKHNIDTPTNEMLYKRVKEIESTY